MKAQDFLRAQGTVKRLGFKLEKIDGEYRVAHGDGPHTYYTENLEDAVSTAKYLATEKQQARVPLRFETQVNSETLTTRLTIEVGQVSLDFLLDPAELKRLDDQIKEAIEGLPKMFR